MRWRHFHLGSEAFSSPHRLTTPSYCCAEWALRRLSQRHHPRSNGTEAAAERSGAPSTTAGGCSTVVRAAADEAEGRTGGAMWTELQTSQLWSATELGA